MSEKFWNGEWPNMGSISIALPTWAQWTLTPASVGIIYRLAMHIGIRSVHGAYHEPDMDPSFAATDKEIRKITRCSRKELKEVEPWLDDFFSLRDGRWRIKDDGVIRYTRPNSRQAIAKDAKEAVQARDGMRCVYCGTTEGPFHHDHIFPVSKGGRNHVHNLVLACSFCNVSKNDRTIREWVQFLIARAAE